MRRRRVPKYRHYKPKNLGLVVLDGRYHYLGKYNSPESLAAYHGLVQRWLAEQPDVPRPPGQAAAPSVDDVLVAFWEHAESHYRTPDGSPTGELENLRLALRPVHALYGASRAEDFGPLALRAVRDAMVRDGLGRTTVNARVNRIRRVFKWAVSVELVPASTYQALQAIPGLQWGRSGARETSGIRPVDVEQVEAVLPHLPEAVAAMVRVQLYTGMRTGEVLIMRGEDLDRTGPVWLYKPPSHKNAWRGQHRVIPLGPRARAVIEGYLDREPADYLFRPRDVVAALHSRRSAERVTRRTPSERSRRVAAPGALHGGCYTRRAYRQAIVRGCVRSGIEPWTPLQLRHAAATAIRSRFGLEAAQVVLGHARCDVTERYAEKNLDLAVQVASEIG